MDALLVNCCNYSIFYPIYDTVKEELKNIRPILKKKDPQIKDPVRFPRVINVFERQSKEDFYESLNIEKEHLLKQMDKYGT